METVIEDIGGGGGFIYIAYTAGLLLQFIVIHSSVMREIHYCQVYLKFMNAFMRRVITLAV